MYDVTLVSPFHNGSSASRPATRHKFQPTSPTQALEHTVHATQSTL